MSIFKRNGIWWIDLYMGSLRRRLRRSLGTRDRETAVALAGALELAHKGNVGMDNILGIVDQIMGTSDVAHGLKRQDKCKMLNNKKEAVRKAVADLNSAHELALLAGLSDMTISRIVNDEVGYIKDSTWKKLYPHVKRFFIENVPSWCNSAPLFGWDEASCIDKIEIANSEKHTSAPLDDNMYVAFHMPVAYEKIIPAGAIVVCRIGNNLMQGDLVVCNIQDRGLVMGRHLLIHGKSILMRSMESGVYYEWPAVLWCVAVVRYCSSVPKLSD